MSVYYSGTTQDKAELRNAPEERYSWEVSVLCTLPPSEARRLFVSLPVGVELVTWRIANQYGNYLVWLRFENKVTPRTVYLQMKTMGYRFCSARGTTAKAVLDAWVENGENFVISNN